MFERQTEAIEFVTDAQRECYTAVSEWVFALYGESAWAREDMPTFSCPVGDVRVGVAVVPSGEHEASVSLWTFPVGDANGEQPSEEAMRFMLEVNARSQWGSFGLHADDSDIVFEYTVEWEGLTKGRLYSLVVTIGTRTRDLRVELARALG